jgi:hypothetical protein
LFFSDAFCSPNILDRHLSLHHHLPFLQLFFLERGSRFFFHLLTVISLRITWELQAYPDATLEMHCQIWEQEQGLRVSPTTMGRAIRRVGWTRKKKRWVPTSRNEEARAAWREHLKQLDARKLVVIDECGSTIALTPLYARAPKGLRASGSAPLK